MDTKQCKFQVKSSDDEGMTFEGYGAVFGNIDDGNDIIEPGAFKETIDANFGRIKILKQHGENSTIPIGKPLELKEDEHGLFIKGKLVDTTDGVDIYKLMKAGVVNEMSIGYDPVEYKEEDIGGIIVRHLTQIQLWEVSLVTWAMNPQAVVTGVKSREPKATVSRETISAMNWRELEELAEWLKEERERSLKERKRAAKKAARLHMNTKS